MGLDYVRLAGLAAGRLDDVGVYGALGQPARVADRPRLFLENLDEQPPDDLALVLGIGDATQGVQEALARVDLDHAHAHVARKGGHHLLRLVVPEHPGVDKDAGQPVTQRPVQQGRHNAGVHAAGQPQYHVALGDLCTRPLDAVADDVLRGPGLLATADVMDESFENAFALCGVGDLRVELDAVKAAAIVGHRGHRCRVGAADDFEARRQFDHLVAVAHPNIELLPPLPVDVVFDGFQKPRWLADRNACVPKLLQLGGLDRTAELRGHRV